MGLFLGALVLGAIGIYLLLVLFDIIDVEDDGDGPDI